MCFVVLHARVIINPPPPPIPKCDLVMLVITKICHMVIAGCMNVEGEWNDTNGTTEELGVKCVTGSAWSEAGH